MKLNAGCGREKLKGYINIDINPAFKPDYIMAVWDLDFDDMVFDEILAKQVIEHLGYFKTIYFLSEALRTLKYEKILIIETVDVEESFKLFLENKDKDVKERICGWIFGSETEYMNHIYCFPEELLERLFERIGFEIVKKEKFLFEYMRPALRYICIKRKKDLKEVFLRKSLVKNGIFNFKDEIVFSETERIIEQLRWENVDKRYLYDLSFVSPIFSYAVCSYVKGEEPSFYLELFKKNFTGYIWERFARYIKLYRSFKVAYDRIKEEYFDNPYQFIYNFMEESRVIKAKKFLITETLLRYDFADMEV
ncbi:MAG: class I SAM-dependent methyltransferase [Elusimicrobiales bacterium]